MTDKVQNQNGRALVKIEPVIQQIQAGLKVYDGIEAMVEEAINEFPAVIDIQTDEDRKTMNSLTRKAGGVLNKIDEIRKGVTRPVDALTAEILQDMRDKIAPLEEEIAKVKTALTAYDKEQARIKQEEQARAAKEREMQLKRERDMIREREEMTTKLSVAGQAYVRKILELSEAEQPSSSVIRGEARPQILETEITGLTYPENVEALEQIRITWRTHSINTVQIIALSIDAGKDMEAARRQILETVGMTEDLQARERVRANQEQRERQMEAQRLREQEEQDRAELIRIGLQGGIDEERITVLNFSSIPSDCYEIKWKKSAIMKHLKDSGRCPGLEVKLSNDVVLK